jgi:hypothetical protein
MGAIKAGTLGSGSENLARIKVTLHESHVARAWFEGEVTT